MGERADSGIKTVYRSRGRSRQVLRTPLRHEPHPAEEDVPLMKKLPAIIDSRRARPRRGFGPLLALAALAVVPLGAQDDPDASDSIARTRDALKLWVQTRQVISAEERDWRMGKDLLESEIQATRNEIDRRRREIEKARAGLTETDQERLLLIESNEELKRSAESLKQTVARLELGIHRLVPRMPAPLLQRDDVRGLLRSLTDPAAGSKASLADRYRVVLGILAALDRFNREVGEFRETLKIGDRAEAEYRTVYLGLGQAFFLSRGRDFGGVGRPGPEGWRWSRVEEGGLPRIVELMKVVDAEMPAKHVELPVVID